MRIPTAEGYDVSAWPAPRPRRIRTALATVLSLTPRTRATLLAGRPRSLSRTASDAIRWYENGSRGSRMEKERGSRAAVRIGCDRVHFPLAAPARDRAGAGEPVSRLCESPIGRCAMAIGYSSCPPPSARAARRGDTRFKRSVRSAGAEKTCFRPIGDRASRPRSTRSSRSDRAVS